MSNIAIIPARGGSKRIPRKNIKYFLGKPIIAYAIEAALQSHLFEEVMVSTEDEEIAKIAEHYGAKIPFLRSAKNASDHATTYDVVDEVLAKNTKKFEYACCIYPCNPFLSIENLKKARQILIENKLDTVFPVIEFSFPIQRAFQLENQKIQFVHPEFALTRTQDLPKRYHDAGQFYFFNVEKTLVSKSIIGNNSGCIILSEMETQDIDNENDWKLAELKYQLLKQ